MKRLALVLVFLPLAARGDDGKPMRDFDKLQVIEGRILCLDCELRKEGADTDCEKNGHRNGLVAADGRMWTVLDNTIGSNVVRGAQFRGKDAKVHAWVFADANSLDMWQLEVKDGDKWTTWSYCIDCGFEEGDNGTENTCKDCRGK